jgi:O-antigen ligase
MLNKGSFFVITILTLILSLYKLEYGIWFVITDLLIGSKGGYLFYFESGGAVISIRMALWLVVMAVWAGKTINSWIKNKKLEIDFFKSSYFFYFLILFIFISWGAFNGFLKGNGYGNIFFDFNNWLYFALIFPIYDVLSSSEEKLKDFFKLFLACSAWIIFKTFFLLFIFSHNIIGVVDWLYRWVRITGVGEITNMGLGFSRIFLQSQIFVLIGFFIFLFLLIEIIKEDSYLKNKNFWFSFFGLGASLSVILISLSRSFWVGLSFGVVSFFIYLFLKKERRKKILPAIAYLFLAGIASIALLVLTAKFPYPRPAGEFSAADILSARALALSGEAAVSSRWSLLPRLWGEIKKAPLLGKGFGATVTYKSSDPRVLETNPKGEYTTYSFEWGWLDIWLKIGFFGLLAYLILIGKIFIAGIRSENKIILALMFGLLAISVVNVFSPYLNHPLGIGYLLICAAVILNKKKELF